MISASNSSLTPIDGHESEAGLTELHCRGINQLWLTVRHGRKVILKGLRPDLREKPEYQALLRKEFELGVKLAHPGVVSIWGWEDRQQTGPCIVMEYVDGMTIGEYLRSDTMARSERLELARELAETLAYVHSMGIAHRDLKPDNVMVTRTGRKLKLIDFGLSDSDDFTIFKPSSGTRSYGAPEQLQGSVGDARSDVYSYGLMLRELKPGMPYHRLIKACLTEEPERRPSMESVVTGLQRISRLVQRWPLSAMGLITVSALTALALGKIEQPAATNETIPQTVTDTVVMVRTIHDTILLPSEPAPLPEIAAPTARNEKNSVIVDNPDADDLFETLCAEMTQLVKDYKTRVEKEPENMAKVNLYTERNEKLTSMLNRFKARIADMNVRPSHISQYESTFWFQVASLSN